MAATLTHNIVLVVGCGLTGAVIARELAEHGNNVIIWERRDHIGGNMYDYMDEHGILVQKYGPHTFHTNADKLFKYICRYAQWEPFKLICGAEIDGICTPSPFNFQTIDDLYAPEQAKDIKMRLTAAFGERKTATVLEVMENNDPVIKAYAELLYLKDYQPYTAKQWGLSPEQIDRSVLNRVPLRFSYNTGYFDDTYQVMPKESYSAFFEHLLCHPNIHVEMGKNALHHIRVDTERDLLLIDGETASCPIVYTGALDELFSCCYGSLPYRSLRFEWRYEDIESKQSMPIIAYPQADGYTRIVEYKKLPIQNVRGTTYEMEYPLQYDPSQNTEPYYPVLTRESIAQYEKYEELAARIPYLYPCGRLADYKYYNMDQALERALEVSRIISDR